MDWLKQRLTFIVSAFKYLLDSLIRWLDRRRLVLATLAIVAFFGAYYVLGIFVVHTIDARTGFRAGAEDNGPDSSDTVALIAALLDREVNHHGWVANDPWFFPTAFMDNMPNYQQGVRATLALFTVELRDQIGRNRGSSAADPDLENAAGKLNYPGDIWIVRNVVVPSESSERAYRGALTALRSYNRRVGEGEATFERRADNLLAALDRLALDLGSSSAALDTHIQAHSNDFMDLEADDLFYNVKGRAYGVYMIMTGLESDFAGIIQDRELGNVWAEAKKSLENLLNIRPWIVANGEVDGMAVPNHLLAQGFYLMRARTQLREITNILLK